MDSNKTSYVNNEESIDLRKLLIAVVRRAWAVILAALIGAGAAFLGTTYFITPKYRASALFYVNGNTLSVGSVSLGDISLAKSLVDSYIVILKSRESLNAVIDYAGLNYTYGQLNGMISANAVNETEIFQVSVTSSDPQEAEKIANAVAYILPKRISGIIEGTEAKVVDYAVAPSAPFSPNYSRNTVLGFLAGAALAVAAIVVLELLDNTIRSGEDLITVTTLPVLANTPDMSLLAKKSGKNLKISEKAFVGNKISFAASEAYKLLRTKLLFSFTEADSSHIIGVSSSLTGEGKTVTAVNLANSLSQLNKRVLLIDCDLRRPSVHKKLGIEKTSGLSEYLTGQLGLDDVIEKYEFKESLTTFDVIVSGENPPNPMELISSAKMSETLEKFRKVYDYVIIDLPPVIEVGDALAVAKFVDGMLMVVRKNYCNRAALSNAIKQFEFIDAKMLGIVYNYSAEDGSDYGRYYRRYYKKYNYHYNSYKNAYISAKRKAKENEAADDVNA